MLLINDKNKIKPNIWRLIRKSTSEIDTGIKSYDDITTMLWKDNKEQIMDLLSKAGQNLYLIASSNFNEYNTSFPLREEVWVNQIKDMPYNKYMNISYDESRLNINVDKIYSVIILGIGSKSTFLNAPPRAFKNNMAKSSSHMLYSGILINIMFNQEWFNSLANEENSYYF